jgi:hypothetical protein
MTSLNLVRVALAVSLAGGWAANGLAQGRLAGVKSLRCTFSLNVTGTWKKDGPADATIKPATLTLVFESIEPDEGTARLRSGTAGTEVIARLAGGYLNFIQSFRTGPMYTTTVFDALTANGKFKAVHSRHEYFDVPLPGATSSPEQYYGECEAPK